MEPVDLQRWFENTRTVLETAYLSHAEPWRQSGMSGPEERWISLRKPVADCIEQNGTFLDIGCANGYLLECVVRWTGDRGLRIDPYGLDVSESLARIARQRLPRYADQIYVGNAFDWRPPFRFDFIRTELVYVPEEHEREYVCRLLEEYLKPEGRLLVANYGESNPNIEKRLLPGCHPTRDILARLVELGFKAETYCDGYDPIKGRRVRIAVLSP